MLTLAVSSLAVAFFASAGCAPADDSSMAMDAAVVDSGADASPSIYDGVLPGECWLDEGICVPREVDEILEAKCRMCHGNPTSMYAPMPLVTLEDFQATHAGASESNALRTRLRINQSRTPMPPITFEQLTPEERDILNAWIDDGYSAGP